MAKIKFKIQALRYPPRIEFGSLQTVKATEYYGNQIKMFCETIKGERPLIPEWGLPRMIHKPDKTPNEIEAIFRNALTKYFSPIVEFPNIICRDHPSLIGVKYVYVEYSVDKTVGTVEINL